MAKIAHEALLAHNDGLSSTADDKVRAELAKGLHELVGEVDISTYEDLLSIEKVAEVLVLAHPLLRSQLQKRAVAPAGYKESHTIRRIEIFTRIQAIGDQGVKNIPDATVAGIDEGELQQATDYIDKHGGMTLWMIGSIMNITTAKNLVKTLWSAMATTLSWGTYIVAIILVLWGIYAVATLGLVPTLAATGATILAASAAVASSVYAGCVAIASAVAGCFTSTASAGATASSTATMVTSGVYGTCVAPSTGAVALIGAATCSASAAAATSQSAFATGAVGASILILMTRNVIYGALKFALSALSSLLRLSDGIFPRLMTSLLPTVTRQRLHQKVVLQAYKNMMGKTYDNMLGEVALINRLKMDNDDESETIGQYVRFALDTVKGQLNDPGAMLEASLYKTLYTAMKAVAGEACEADNGQGF